MNNEFNTEYEIKNGNIILKGVQNFIKCSVCQHNVAMSFGGKILVKTFVTLLDVDHGEIVVKCGKCKSFNSIKIEEANSKKSKCLLMV